MDAALINWGATSTYWAVAYDSAFLCLLFFNASPDMVIGTIQQIWRYPVKSMAGENLRECSVQSLGIPGDRGWAFAR